MTAVSRPKKFPRLFHRGNGSSLSLRRRRLGKHSTSHFVRIGFRSAHDDFPEVSVLFHERRHEFIKESEYIVADQHLAVALRTGSDADGGNLQPGSHFFGDQIRNGVEH